jgi:hypothetical protein
MKDVETEQNRIKCPFCAEMILPEAKICRFCKSNLVIPEQSNPGLMKVMVWNVICPGLGAWKLGHRIRGTIIFALVIGFLLLYANAIVPVINKAVNTAIRTGNTRKLSNITREIEHNPWAEFSLYVYAYSFFELYFLFKRKNPENESLNEKKD